VTATVHDLLAAPYMRHAEISPSGRFAAAIFVEKDVVGVRVKDVVTGIERDLAGVGDGTTATSIESLRWDGENALLVTYGGSKRRGLSLAWKNHDLFELSPGEKSIDVRATALKTPGEIVDASPSLPGEVLFAPAAKPNSVHRVATKRLAEIREGWASLDAKSEGAPRELATLEDHVVAWLVDPHDEVRAALAVSTDPVELRLWHRERVDAKWRVVRRESNVDDFDDVVPLGFDASGEKLLVASALERDRYGLYEYDPKTDRVGALIYEHPTAELVGLLFDSDRREVLGVAYVEDGEYRYAYLGTRDDTLHAAISARFPDDVVSITGLSANRRRVSLMLSRSNDPGGFVTFDLDTNAVAPVGRVAPWLDDALLAPTRVFEVESRAGRTLDAFLTLPPTPVSKPPLVVMPHGGPIGIADLRGYSGNVQYLARSGFAVLRVNYRGSGGYGRAFEKAGQRQWGRGIEDDIDDAVAHAVAQGWVDGNRMCTVGGSYGGYSALMTVIRHPDRYRCAASLNGVTDIALMFNVDELTGGETLTAVMAEIVGDPEENYEEMRRYSPVYNADRIEVPIYLAHGEWDRTVDIEHMVRMKLALSLAKVPMRLYTIPKTGHGFSTRDDAVRYWLSLREFLAEYLRP